MQSRQLVFSSFLCALLLIVCAGASFAQTRTDNITSGGYRYYDISLPSPQSGARLVLSSTASSDISLYSGSDHDSGNLVASSTGQTLHTLLVSPASLTDGGLYHVRIKANADLTYSFTDDLTYARTLTWDPGSALAGTNIMDQPDSAGGDYLFRITGQAPLHPAWRTVLNVQSGEAELYLQQDAPPLGGGSYNSAAAGSDAIYVNADQSLAGQTWYIRVHATPGASWNLLGGDLFVQELSWDNGGSPTGTNTIGQPATIGGDYFFRITSNTPANGAWRTVLNVLGGEADFYLQQGTPPLADTYYKSTRTGSDGAILDASQFGNNQTWYIRVRASGAASTWNIFSGEVYVRDLGSLSDTSSIPSVTIGPEGTYYFRTSVDANTLAWRLWLNGDSLPMYVKQALAPVKSPWIESAEQTEPGQMLLVPPYLTNAAYFIGVNGAPGTSFTLDSRKQQIHVPGGDNFKFSLSGGDDNGFGYVTYRIDVPVQQIAWQVNLTPGEPDRNPEMYIRQGNVPNRWMNSAFSEAPAGVTDSITQVPPTLSDGAWYVTVYGSGSFSYSLESKNPVITPATYINTSDPDPVPPGYAFPYNTVPITNDETSRSGWRYYQVSDINSQLGFLGWQLDLAGQVTGSTIALRRNAVPASWRYRSGGSAYNTGISDANHVDLSSSLGFLQQPGHQADVWYVGVYTPDQALGAFQLTTREIPAPLQGFTQSSAVVTDQPAQTWRWFKVTVPAGALGWDLRLTDITSGQPRMVVRRDQLPADLNTSGLSNPYAYQYHGNSWPTGNQWGNETVTVAGMGTPLEPGTYYVGVSRPLYSQDTSPLGYTLQSRGIGVGNDPQGNPWPIQVQDLAFSGAGSSAGASGLVAGEAAYYRVTVPPGTRSWSLVGTPTAGDIFMAVRQGALPNSRASVQQIADGTTTGWGQGYGGALRQKAGEELFYKYPAAGDQAITSGVYYVAVWSQGTNGVSGAADYTLTSIGELPVSDRSATPLEVGTPLQWNGESLSYGQQKAYRFRIPAGLTSLEVRLKNRVGNPVMRIRQDPVGGGLIPGSTANDYYYKADEGGSSPWQGNASLLTVAQPAAGDYTVLVWADAVGGNPADATCDLEVTPLVPAVLAVTGAGPQSGSLVDQQVRYYRLTIPETFNNVPVVGWKIRVETANGKALLRIRKDAVPTSVDTGTLSSDKPMTTIVPPFLTPGTWFLEVKGVGLTDYSLTSEIITPQLPLAAGLAPPFHSRSWSMPARDGSFTQTGIPSPYVGDSGIDDLGNDIVNPSTGDLGIDLANGEYHYYRIVVPDNNAGLLRTVVEALSGKPELYIRKDYPPSLDHKNDADPNLYYAGYPYDRSQSISGTMYGNWVPIDGRIESQLPPGDWWLAVKAVNSNIRYRLKVAAGNVRDGGGPLDSAGYVQDLAMAGGSTTAQSLVAGDMRYYRVTVPQSSVTTVDSTPIDWILDLQRQVGDVVIFIRDSLPPGQGTLSSYAADDGTKTPGSGYFQDWYDDHISQNPNPYGVISADGTTVLSLPPIKPGRTYFLGVYAKTDATFDLSSTIGAERLRLDDVIPFAGGTATKTLAAGESTLYRVDVPADALFWVHTAQHDPGIKLYMTQDTVPPADSTQAHWSSCSPYDNNTCSSDAGIRKYLFESANLNNYPWQPGHSYYLMAVNTSGGPLPFTFTMDGRTGKVVLTINRSGTGSGVVDGSIPEANCAADSCSANLMPFTPVYISPGPAPGSTFTGWSGAACAGQSWGCQLTMEQSTSVTANFALNNWQIDVYSNGSGGVSSVPAGISCPGSCSANFDHGTPLTLTATPSPGYSFSGWSGVCSGTGACSFTVTQGAWVTASFVADQLLTVDVAGSGGGTVTSVQPGRPTGIACASGTTGNCSASFAYGTAVDLTPTPINSTFANWSGDCSGSGACSVTMNSAKYVTANFIADPAKLMIDGEPTPYYRVATVLNALPSRDRTVRALAQVFTEDVIMDNPSTIILFRGGYMDPEFIVAPEGAAVTTIEGSLRIRSGTLKVERLIIK